MTAAILSAKRWLAADGDAGRRGQRALGFLVAGAGLVAMSGEALAALYRWLASNPALLPALLQRRQPPRRLSQKAESSMLCFGAGAMLFVASHEVVPEPHRKGHEQHATLGLIPGFVLMMSLDTALA